ncbi:MAG TPA: hypothetical protein VGI24_05370 [Solirubrobacteraceae bacterium]|jgi:hypothetical protein
MTRLADDWRAMQPEQRLAVLASLALLVTMFLPWYSLQSLSRKTTTINTHNINAFGDISFVEAAVFLVAAGVVTMILARAEGREFHLPGSDGTVTMIAGGWAALLIFYRVFSRPSGHGYPVGIQWGFFLAFVAAGGLTYAGWRMRIAHRPEPPVVRHRPRRPPAPMPAPPPVLPAGKAPRAARRPVPANPARANPAGAASSARTNPASEQLSFEDAPTEPEQRSA